MFFSGLSTRGLHSRSLFFDTPDSLNVAAIGRDSGIVPGRFRGIGIRIGYFFSGGRNGSNVNL